jgi:FkbM family methyltransferase
MNGTKPETEPIVNAIVAGLINERRLLPGSIVDAGAFDGTWALWVAERWPQRAVHAIDPLAKNVHSLKRRAPSNLRAFFAALGHKSGALYLDKKAQQRAAKSGYLLQKGASPEDGGPSSAAGIRGDALRVPVRTLDDLFASDWAGERLALLHLDVEGAEREVLRGSVETLRRDMPLLTVEVHVHMQLARTRTLVRFLAANRYEVFLVEEICGMRADCRNLFCVHRGARRAFWGSDTLDMAIASRAMFAVDASTIGHHAFPCCARGEECCTRAWSCCAHSLVHRWLGKQIAVGGTDVRLFARTRWFDHKAFVYRQHAMLHALHLRELRRPANESGLSYTLPGGW